jgi:2-keto-3-deoxy-L-rhamnonate aldolase RhmA
MSLDLFLFSTDPRRIAAAIGAGAAGIVIDWERRGKEERQAGADTQINADTFQDLVDVRRHTSARVICRINAWGPWTSDEVELAIEGGADEILVPMVRGVEEVQEVMEAAGGRVGVGILVETEAAVSEVGALSGLPLARMYVGLNDLAIDRGVRNIFEAVVDGTVERVTRGFQVPVGFAGLTLAELGNPIPCRLLMAEMVRLGCDFTFLRRSFLRDVAVRETATGVRNILSALEREERGSQEQRRRDREALEEAIREWPSPVPRGAA